MSMIRKNMEITLKTDPNLADLLLQGCRQIIEQLADEFNLDKSTIELGKTFDRETELIGSNKKVYTINTIKYNNYYLAVAFGLIEAHSGPANTLISTVNGMSYIASNITKFDTIHLYKGCCIQIVFLKNKDDNFLTTEYQTLPYNTYYVDATSNKNIFNFNVCLVIFVKIHHFLRDFTFNHDSNFIFYNWHQRINNFLDCVTAQ